MLARRLRRRPNIKTALVYSVSDAAQYESGDTSLHSAPHLTMSAQRWFTVGSAS